LPEAATKKPHVLLKYLLKLNFSLNKKVTPKSTIIPERPTTPNFRNLKNKVLVSVIGRAVGW
jgi:hypothetical protein